MLASASADPAQLLVPALAGLLGGMLNAVAGGGSFITLPALVMAGLNPVSANATGTAALLPGYLASAWRFRHDIELPPGLGWGALLALSLVGGLFGGGLLLVTNPLVFDRLVPWLIAISTLVFAVSPRLRRSKATAWPASVTVLALLAVCVYGGYFNGGLGVILLCALLLAGQNGLAGMNGLKNLISAVLTSVAVLMYALGGLIEWRSGLVMMVAGVLGGYFGAAASYWFSDAVLRGFVVLVGALMAAAFFLGLPAQLSSL